MISRTSSPGLLKARDGDGPFAWPSAGAPGFAGLPRSQVFDALGIYGHSLFPITVLKDSNPSSAKAKDRGLGPHIGSSIYVDI
jgi:hypothetical protein